MIIRIARTLLLSTALVMAACSPSGVVVEAQVPVTGGGTATPPTPTGTHTPVIAPTDTPAAQGAADASISAELEGAWYVTQYASGTVSLLGEAEAQTYLGKQAVFASDSISFDGQTCTDAAFLRRDGSLSAFFGTDAAALSASLHISREQVQVIETTCALAGFGSFVQLDPGTLIINLNGTFFVLQR